MAHALSTFFSRVRGSIGSFVFYPGHDHQINVRARTSPVVPGSTEVLRRRAAFANAVALWQSLSDSDRSAWNDYGMTVGRWERGSVLSYVGYTAFMQSLPLAWYARARGWLVADPIGTPPSIPGYLRTALMELKSVPSGQTGYRFQGAHKNAETCFALYHKSAEFGPSINLFKGPWARCEHFDRTTNDPIVLTTTGMTEGNVIFTKFYMLSNQEPFRISMRSIIRGVAVAVP